MNKSVLFSVVFMLLVVADFSAQDMNGEPEVNVVHFADFSEDLNMEVYSHFMNDASQIIVNSCDALGVIVFAPKDGEVISRSQARAYLSVKLGELNMVRSNEFEFVDDITAGEVLMQCRQRMQEIYETEED